MTRSHAHGLSFRGFLLDTGTHRELLYTYEIEHSFLQVHKDCMTSISKGEDIYGIHASCRTRKGTILDYVNCKVGKKLVLRGTIHAAKVLTHNPKH